jgi:DNA-binding SARP family transcriptional activator
MKTVLIIITILYSSSIFARSNNQKPLLCETSLISRQQYKVINRLGELDSLLKLHNTSIHFVFLSEKLSSQDIDNYIRNKGYKKNVLPANHPVWMNKQELIASKSFIILLSTRNDRNSLYVHRLYRVQKLSEKLPETLPYQSFIMYNKRDNICDTAFYSSLKMFWKLNLRPVHIILTDDMGSHEKLKSLIEAQCRVFGTFLYQNKPLGDVRITPGIKSTSGYFSFPFNKYIRVLPQKNGYSFEPSCVASNFESQELERKVIAFPLKLEDKKIAEASVVNIDQLQLYEVDMVNFKGKRSAFSFQKPTSQISLKNSSVNTGCSEFSISFWIYPTSKAKYQNIISQDTIFNIKLFNGIYCFTRVGVADFQLPKTPVIFNNWSFMTFVEEQNTLTVYCNGIKTQQINITPITLANRDFQIGNNIWEEHFRGYLSDVSIWERALSSDEVLQLYKSPATNTKNLLLYILPLLLILLVCTWIVIIRNRKKPTGIAHTRDNDIKKHHRIQKDIAQRRIQFIGNLHIWNENKEDISLSMSSKQKQLFCLLALHTIENGMGISSSEINDTLWPMMDAKSANNNRNVYIMRLKEVLVKAPEIQVVFQKKHWKIIMEPNISCDYMEILDFESELKEKNYSNFSQYLGLLDNDLLVNIQDIWIDKFKSKFEEERLNNLEILLNESFEIKNHAQCLQIANAMLSLDEFNEFAFEHKIKALNNLGKKSIANKCIQSYKLRYDEIYGQSSFNPYS